ncbi:poly-gamma-glutamate capsule biosynthesis protein CapA/YwtB (metallophosphatase superfamily) [Frigoribacterium sp. PhB107]|uniref:CapA family protein n=1 Tax=Frigoribacterium sp. PhB107 TaxID=2485172 RepID=UPI000F466F1A|nr:CapA family protein [Frigoribacterium sp. PhB107]ROP75231.1 poly-gamma-glutamate capsule biosynthesis protein CapA/YwtB (metallophosphatase superfamily) [Frigoribacterium sp. PhB107]
MSVAAASAPASTSSPASREGWADALKGLLIVLVVLWHVVLKSTLQVDWQLGLPVPGAWGLAVDAVWPFLMPAFVLVSGVFAAGALARPWSAVLRPRVLRFAWLYLLWSLIHTAALWAFPEFPTFVPRSVAEFVEAVTISPMSTWYLYALVLYFVVAKALRRVPPVVVVAAAAALSVVVSSGLVEVVSNRGQLLGDLVFFVLGASLAPWLRRVVPGARLRVVLGLVAVYAAAFAAVRVTGSATVPGAWLALSLLGSSAVLAASPWLARLRGVGPVLVRLGRRSLPIYLLHMPLLALADHLLAEPLSGARVGAKLVAATALPVALTAALVGICLVIDRLAARDGLGWLWDLPGRRTPRAVEVDRPHPPAGRSGRSGRTARLSSRAPWRAGAAVLLLVLGGVAGTRAQQLAGCTVDLPARPAAADGQVSIGAVGDVLMHDVGHRVPADGGASHFDEVRPWFTEDLVTGNLEQVVADDTGFDKCAAGSDCLAFRSDPGTAAHLAGFDLMNMANNHTGDFGPVGYRETREALAGQGIAAVGERDEIVCTRIGSTVVAVVGFAPYAGTNRVTDFRHVRKLVAAARRAADVVVVHAHMGAEGPDANVVRPGPEQMFGEDRGDPVAFAHAAVDAGADLVVGHGPHSLRGAEFRDGKLIAYSLGNFGGGGVFGAEEATRHGVYLDVVLDADGSFVRGQLRSARFDFVDGRPVPDPTGKAADLVREFGERDLPATTPRIGPDGELSPRG